MPDVNLFGRKIGGDKPQDKDLNQLVFDVAEHKRASDRDELFKRLNNLELFSPVVSANFSFEAGHSRVKIEKDMELKIRTQEMQGLVFASFLVNQDDPRLGDNFIGMSVKEVFNMVEASNNLNGIIFYNDKESYICITQENFAVIRQRHLR